MGKKKDEFDKWFEKACKNPEVLKEQEAEIQRVEKVIEALRTVGLIGGIVKPGDSEVACEELFELKKFRNCQMIFVIGWELIDVLFRGNNSVSWLTFD